jgi:serine/threonine protein kinase
MGMVFRALDMRKVEARDPKPEVAVKILNASFEQHPDAFVALQREASKAQSLAHPNIVTVFDFDRDGESVFITMELLVGRSLDDAIRADRGLDRATALPVIRGIAEGLAYAHRKGIVHSDLKPANIFLTADKTPKLLDFGIARAVPSADSGPKDQFDAGSLGAYTEGYATEEMVEGKDPAPADDMYAFGIIVYELLTGRHPFGDKGAAQARAAGLTPAPIRSLRRREWQTLARTLAFDRAQRPRDAAEFLRLFFGTTRLRNALIAALGALVVVSGVFWYRTYQQSGPAMPFEQLPAETQQQITSDFAEGEKAWTFYANQGIANALTDSLSYYADAYRLHKGNRQAVRGLERAADEMLKRVGRDPAARRETAQHLAETSDFLKSYAPVVDAE